MVDEIFENSSLLRGALLRFRESDELAAFSAQGPNAESEAHAWILAQYLQFTGTKDVSVMTGSIKDDDTETVYAWVDADGITADISAKRFPASQTLVIISLTSIFHSLIDKPTRTKVNPTALKERSDYVEAFHHLLRKHPALKQPAGSEAAVGAGSL